MKKELKEIKYKCFMCYGTGKVSETKTELCSSVLSREFLYNSKENCPACDGNKIVKFYVEDDGQCEN